MDLASLATHYVNHANIDWKQYEKARSYSHLDMPLYPWQHKKYWPAFDNTYHELAPITYPMRGKVLSSPLPVRKFEFVFDTVVMPEIGDAFNVLHAGYYLEMLAYATKQMQKSAHFNVQNLTYLSPIIVLDGKTVSVQLIIETSEQNTLSFKFYSNDGKDHWLEHATGNLSFAVAPPYAVEAKKELIKRLPVSDTAETFYARLTGMGMPAGDTIRWTHHYWLSDKELLCELQEPKKSERDEQFTTQMHPGIIDACIKTLFLLLPKQFNKPYIASHMGQIECYEKLDDQKYIYTVLKELHPEEKKIIGDWYLLDKNYRLLAKCHDLCMSVLNDTMQIDKRMAIQSQCDINFSLPYEECKNQVIHYLIEQFATIFAMPKNDISPHQSLHEFGMDSLMSLAVIRVIESSLGVTYSLPLMMQVPSAHDIAEDVLASQWLGSKPTSPQPKPNSDSPWIANLTVQANTQVRLFCFPYGGGASIYREWQHAFPDFIEVCPIQLPGRANRMQETPLAHIDALISELATHLKPLLDVPFAFFGHSFGSLIGFELTRYLRRHRLPQPIHLFASAYHDPRKPSKSLDNLLVQLKQMNLNLFELDQERISQLDEAQLTALSRVFKDNGIVDYSDERMNQSIIKVLLPIFIGDMNIVKSYAYYDESPLELATTVFIGKKDSWVVPEDHMGWADHSLAPCEFQHFDSGHLFIRGKEIRLQVIKKLPRPCIMLTMQNWKKSLDFHTHYV
ncbi:MAG: thioesterase domain-containing protein [Legionella sp.]